MIERLGVAPGEMAPVQGTAARLARLRFREGAAPEQAYTPAMWRLEDHTADVRLLVEAADWPGLLEEAAAAFAGYVAGGERPRGKLRRVRKLAIGAPTAAEAWVQWWRELLRLWAVEGLLPLSAGVREDATPAATHAVVRCAPAEHLDPGALTDVKAVTRHGAEAEGGAGGWRGRIVLDV